MKRLVFGALVILMSSAEFAATSYVTYTSGSVCTGAYGPDSALYTNGNTGNYHLDIVSTNCSVQRTGRR